MPTCNGFAPTTLLMSDEYEDHHHNNICEYPVFWTSQSHELAWPAEMKQQKWWGRLIRSPLVPQNILKRQNLPLSAQNVWIDSVRDYDLWNRSHPIEKNVHCEYSNKIVLPLCKMSQLRVGPRLIGQKPRNLETYQQIQTSSPASHKKVHIENMRLRPVEKQPSKWEKDLTKLSCLSTRRANW
jgi:hypothetical protein